MAGCDQYHELMSAYIDGETTPEENKLLKEHLDSCPECSSLFQTLVLLSNELSEMQEEPPDLLAPGIMQKVGQEIRRKKSPFAAIVRYAAAAAVIAVVIFAAGRMFPMASDSETAADGSTLTAAENGSLKDAEAADGETDESAAEQRTGDTAGGMTLDVPDADADGDYGAPLATEQPEPSDEAPSYLLTGDWSSRAKTVWEANSYSSEYYSVSTIEGAVPELIENCELIYDRDREQHYKVPAELIIQLEEEKLFSDIFYDNSSAEYGIVVVYLK